MRKTSFFIILFSMLFISSQLYALTIKIDPDIIDPGKTSTFDVVIEDASDLGAFEFDLGYDAGVVTIESITLGDFLESTGRNATLLPSETDNSLGKLHFGTFTSAPDGQPDTEGPSGNGTLATVNFSVDMESDFWESHSESVLEFNTNRSYLTDTEANAFSDAEWRGAIIAPTFKLTANAGNHGTISPEGELIVKAGSNQIFNITPEACYNIADVQVDGDTVGAVSFYTFDSIDGDHTITASFTSKPPLSIEASSGEGGSISPSGTVPVNCGASKTFSITPGTTLPDQCYHIKNVIVDGVSKGAITSHTFENVTGNHTISATFALNDYTITASAGAGGTISPSGTVPVPCGDQTFTITPDTGYHIEDVLKDGDSQGPVTSCKFENITENHNITATFAVNPPNVYTITPIAEEHGNIDPSEPQQVTAGSKKTFTIIPEDCYQIANVTTDGNSVMANVQLNDDLSGIYTFESVDKHSEIKAVFEKMTYSIKVITNEGGSVTPPDGTNVECGNDQTFEITPDDCYEIKNIKIDGESISPVSSYMFFNVRTGHTIEVEFGKIVYTITATSEGSGSISPAGEITVECGDNKIIEFTSEEGFEVVEVTTDGKLAPGAKTSHTFENVTSDHRIHVIFGSHIITASAGANGKIEPEGDVKVDHGKSYVFTMTPDLSYHIADVSIDDHSVMEYVELDEESGAGTYEFKKVTEAHAIYVIFGPHTITASAEANGTIEPSGEVKAEHGEDRLFTITPDDFYQIGDIRADGDSIMDYVDIDEASGIGTYEFKNVTQDHTIEAVSFECAVAMGDIDGNKKIDIKDAVLILKLLSGADIDEEKLPVACSDVNGDENLGMEELLYILKTLTE
ncbi:InlB B-repeat-containing protein [Desulfonema magnum]|nr:cohesin domain-containing protein [Desulfonema magnum]